MKKLVIFFIVIIMIVALISYIYINHQFTINEARRENAQYESYNEQEIYGTDLATLINKATDTNIQNHIEKNDEGLYIDNQTNSIRMDIKFTDDDTVHSMEEIYNGGTNIFVQYYNQIKFKCMEIKYHDKTGKVSYMYFEQMAT